MVIAIYDNGEAISSLSVVTSSSIYFLTSITIMNSDDYWNKAFYDKLVEILRVSPLSFMMRFAVNICDSFLVFSGQATKGKFIFCPSPTGS